MIYYYNTIIISQWVGLVWLGGGVSFGMCLKQMDDEEFEKPSNYKDVIILSYHIIIPPSHSSSTGHWKIIGD